MRDYYLVISIVNIMGLLILSYVIHKSSAIDSAEQLLFLLSILAIILVILSEVTTVFFDRAQASFRLVCIIGNAAGFSIAPFIPILLGYMVGGRPGKLSLLFGVPALVNLVLSLFSAEFPLIFFVSPENVYRRGDFFWIFCLSYSVSAAYLFLETVRASRRYQNSSRVFFALFLFTGAGTSVQVLFPSLRVSWLCISMAICLYYIYYCDLRHQIDGLTLLLTRGTYEKFLEQIRGKKNASIFIFDIDNFKSINDRYGHPFGDFCIKTTADCIRDVFSKTGLCFRTGGDEFCVIDTSSGEDFAEFLCRCFLRKIDDMRKKDPSLPTVSIGCAQYNRKSGTISNAIFHADQQMYRFKQDRKQAAQDARCGTSGPCT